MTLKADEMFCHAVYTAAHVINRAYAPLLADLGLTYPQYITLTLLRDRNEQSVGALASALRMDSSTLTPLLKRLETQGHVTRARGLKDERQVFVRLTPKGRASLKKAPEITGCMIEGTGLKIAELQNLVTLLGALSDNLASAQIDKS